jgi:hypothetical protein
MARVHIVLDDLPALSGEFICTMSSDPDFPPIQKDLTAAQATAVWLMSQLEELMKPRGVVISSGVLPSA